MSAAATSRSRPGSVFSLFVRPIGWVLLLAWLATTAGAFRLQWGHMKTYKETPWTESFALPRPEYVRYMAMGYDSWLADFLFLRSIQAFGGVFSSPGSSQQYEAVFNYFDSITALDPHFIEVYQFGNLVMGDEGGRQKLALEFLRKGQEHNWRKYLPWYEAAYVKVWALKETDDEARFFVRQAVKCPDAPSHIYRTEHYIDELAGKHRMALEKWVQTCATAIDSGDDLTAGISLNKIKHVVDGWNKTILQDGVDRFLEDTGRAPRDLREVDEKGFLPPVDTFDVDLLVENLEKFEASGEPVAPRVGRLLDLSTSLKGGIPPRVDSTETRWVLQRVDESDERVVTTEAERRGRASIIVSRYRSMIADHLREQGKHPASAEDLVVLPQNVHLYNPYGGPWFYDSETGVVLCPQQPEL
jgi:hypothetical protein